MYYRLKLFGNYNIYISNIRLKKNPKKPFEGNLKSWRKYYIKPFIKKTGNHCMICGKYDEHCGIHHILPQSTYPELMRCRDNLIFICNECHRKIHNNPYINIAMMLKKMKQLGVENKYQISHEEKELFIQF